MNPIAKLSKLQSFCPDVEFVPALLSRDEKYCYRIFANYYNLVQSFDFDIIDKSFKKNLPTETFNADEYLDIFDDFILENNLLYDKSIGFHLMTQNWDQYLTPRIVGDASQIIFQFDCIDITDTNFYEYIKQLKAYNQKLKIGLSINWSDQYKFSEYLETHYFDHIKKFDILQLMTVVPGNQGMPFVPEAIKIMARLLDLRCELKIDGGISPDILSMLDSQQLRLIGRCKQISVGSYLARE